MPILRKIKADPDLNLHLIVSGMHLSDKFGMTVDLIESDGFEVDCRVEIPLDSDSPESVSKSMGMGTISFATVFSKSRPDVLIVLGDRYEMHSAAVAALPFNIPVAHIHGGELTEGAIDNSLRHSMTHLSHIHYVATEESRDRVMQLGVEPSRVLVTGAPSLDNLHEIKFLDKQDLEAHFGWNLSEAPLLVTFHPVTLEYEQTERYMAELLAALDAWNRTIVFTSSNADTGGAIIEDMLQKFVGNHPKAFLVNNLGTQRYFSLMTYAAAMVGNSSSGLIEAPSFGLPVVNIGTRQQGRTRGSNVIDVGYSQHEITAGISAALETRFRQRLSGKLNPYGDGQASTRIVSHIKTVALNQDLITKRFVDFPGSRDLTPQSQ
jgi:UDP-hydrolysing UDP-N-acetyl-D-glucosamine 2-epimerase